MRKVTTFQFIIILIFCVTVNAIAQDAASVTWELILDEDVSATSGNITGRTVTGNNMSVRDYNGTLTGDIAGPLGNYQRWWLNANWPDESTQNDTRYIQFTVESSTDSSFNATSISLYINAGGTGNMKANLYYSTDPNFTDATLLEGDLSVSRDTAILNEYSINVQIGDGGVFCFRIYPWLPGGSTNTGKYIYLQNVTISGTASGSAIIYPPTISTTPITNISTTTANSGGNISADGGSEVFERGVCWNTTGNPTIQDSKTSDGTGTGSFAGTLIALELGTTYYVRAYATNSAGTSYGEELSFTTLTELSIPRIFTMNISNILATSAFSTGYVTSDGGLEVTARGMCWNTTGSPTIDNDKTEDGSGLGFFQSNMKDLAPETEYFAQAYATNAVGTGYGAEKSFTTLEQKPPMEITVAQDGSGDYTTVQAAFDAAPDNYTGPITIFVKNGIYEEKISLSQNKINVTLVGEDPDSTILTYDDYSGRIIDDGTTLGTSTSYSVAINADDFTAKNITFQNTSQSAQAVALRVSGDRAIFHNCRMIGYQDTYYTYGYGRIYNKDCYIEGTVDFIFGRSIAVFDNCIIISKRNSTITAASTEENYKFGYVFFDCIFVPNAGINRVYLGRPWRPYAQTVVIHSELGSHIDPAGWLEWSGNNNHETAYYAEYDCFGPGYVLESRVSWSHQLTAEEAAEYTLENIFSKKSASPEYNADWLPVVPSESEEEIPDAGL